MVNTPAMGIAKDESYTRSGSTTWQWRKVKVNPPPGGDRAPQALRYGFHGVRKRDAHRPIWLTMRYRGGAEAQVVIECRGRVKRFPGSTALFDVLKELSEGSSWTD